jgi:geranylgeranyl reductase family protein
MVRRAGSSDNDADVIVVGAGPAGSTAAAYLARSGLDVLLLEKSTFPREKVCGDGLTPRGIKQLIDLGIDTSAEAGWLHNRGLRVVGGGVTIELDWPELASFPPYGAVRQRQDFDEMLARHAEKAGARLHERTTVTEAITDARTGRVVGVKAKQGPDKQPVAYRAPIALACDGVSARLALSLGIKKREDRPMGVGVRRYYTTPRTNDEYLESHVEIWDRADPKDPKLLPGYGWIFGMGDGTSNVGLGILSTSSAYGKTDYRALLRSWLDGTPEQWGFREANATGKILGAALPMSFNRTPHYRGGLLLVGDAGGMVNPFNGEGIAYAMESGEMAAEVMVGALSEPEGPRRERALSAYPEALAARYGGYYTLGRWFVRLIGDPRVMRLATQRGLSHPTLMRLTLKLLANLTDPSGGDALDRIVNALSRVAPAA